MTRTSWRARVRLAATCLTIAACSGHESHTVQQARLDSVSSALGRLGDTAHLFAAASGHRYGAPTGKLRVANLRDPSGHTGEAIDIYDMAHPDSAAVPLVRNLGYGQISAYFSPRAGDPYAGSPSQIYDFPTGTRQASLPFGTNMDNSGFVAGDQLTLAVGPSSMFGGGAGMSEVTLIEEGKRIPRELEDTVHAIPAGHAMLITRTVNDNVDSMPEQYLAVDGKCPQTTTDSRAMGFAKPVAENALMHFPIAPGSHALAVVTSPRGHGLTTCGGHAPGQATTLSAEAGHRYLALIYGQPSDGIKVLAASIDAP